MHTPGHAVLNWATLGSALPSELAVPVLLGALLPDVPIVILYLREKLRRTPDEQIWSVAYQRPFWLNLIHGAHSIPLSLAALIAASLLGQAFWSAFFGSVLLHAASDLPVHNQDAHRHFFPFSNYRFISPISYWDLEHHGKIFALLEAVAVWIASVWIGSRGVGPVALAGLALADLFYLQSYYRTYLAPAKRAAPSA